MGGELGMQEHLSVFQFLYSTMIIIFLNTHKLWPSCSDIDMLGMVLNRVPLSSLQVCRSHVS